MNKRKLRYSFIQIINAVENLKCEDLHHKKSHEHDHGEMCPVEYDLYRHAHIIREHMKEIGL